MNDKKSIKVENPCHEFTKPGHLPKKKRGEGKAEWNSYVSDTDRDEQNFALE